MSEEEVIELKPCPFCGAPVEFDETRFGDFDHRSWIRGVRCTNVDCKATTAFFSGAWNVSPLGRDKSVQMTVVARRWNQRS